MVPGARKYSYHQLILCIWLVKWGWNMTENYNSKIILWSYPLLQITKKSAPFNFCAQKNGIILQCRLERQERGAVHPRGYVACQTYPLLWKKERARESSTYWLCPWLSSLGAVSAPASLHSIFKRQTWLSNYPASEIWNLWATSVDLTEQVIFGK